MKGITDEHTRERRWARALGPDTGVALEADLRHRAGVLLESLLVLCGVAAGSVWTWARGRTRERELAKAEQKALASARDVDVHNRFLEKRVELRDTQLARVEKQRDDYATIASTHEISTPRWRAGEWVRKVWKDRRFSGHPRQNLDDLQADFAAFGDEHVLASLDIELLGGWKTLFGGSGDGAITTPVSAGRTLLFEGPAPRVLEQIVTFVRDDDTGFLESAEDEAPPRWRDEDSPMIWTLTVDVMDSGESNHVEYVDVLRIQKEVVEVIVEKPVLRSLPDDVASSLEQHTKEEIVTLIEAVLEVRELQLPGRLHAEREALPEALGGSPDDAAVVSRPPASSAADVADGR